jgi:hypothetical protein
LLVNQQVVATVPEMGAGDSHDALEPPDDGGEAPAEPLEIVPYPVEIDAYDPEVGGPSVVRLFFQPGDHAAAPEVDLAEVVVLESWDRVSIALVRRGVTGEGPDGVNYGESLLRRAKVSLDVALAEPLGKRPLVDAWTGSAVRRVERRSDAPLHTEAVGTPLWRQF